MKDDNQDRVWWRSGHIYYVKARVKLLSCNDGEEGGGRGWKDRVPPAAEES